MEKQLKFGEVLSHGWELFKKIVETIIILELCLFGYQGVRMLATKITEGNPAALPLMLGFFVLDLFVSVGFIQVTLRMSRGDVKVYPRDLLGGAEYIWRYFLASILYGLIVLGGLILLVVPGIIFAVKYMYYSYLIVDKDMQPLEAIKKSGEITKGFKMQLFLFGLLIAVLIMISMIPFGLGLVVSLPVMAFAGAYIYRILIDDNKEGSAETLESTHDKLETAENTSTK